MRLFGRICIAAAMFVCSNLGLLLGDCWIQVIGLSLSCWCQPALPGSTAIMVWNHATKLQPVLKLAFVAAEKEEEEQGVMMTKSQSPSHQLQVTSGSAGVLTVVLSFFCW